MPEAGKPIFLDPTGRRAWRLRLGSAVVALAALVLLAGFAVSVAQSPRFASLAATNMRQPALPHHAAAKQLAAERKILAAKIAADRRAKASRVVPSTTQIAGAYYAPWRENSLSSFRQHAADLTHIYPAWVELAPDGRSLVTATWSSPTNPATRDLATTAKANGVAVVPVVSNAQNGTFDARRMHAMLDDPAAAKAIADGLEAFVRTNGYAGVQIDFELMDADYARKLAPWVAALHARLKAEGRELSVTIETTLDTESAKRLAAGADYAVIMAYDEHEQTSGPGPVASADYTEAQLKRLVGVIGADKSVLGVGAYGYDWNVPEKTAEAITNQKAIALAARFRAADRPQDAIDYDPTALEPTFQYNDERGQLHEVWFMDATSAANAMTLARDHHIRGGALWALGMEDTSVWTVFGRRVGPKPDLHDIIASQQVAFIGDGELLRVLKRPQPGSRTFETDPNTGLITDEDYVRYPTGWLVERSGAPEKTLCLTFDDGPDPTWTPKILDVLKRHNIKATFFMIGQQVADQPDLVQRVYNEGHEIGSHSYTHPNMAHVGEERVRLELSATQRAFEAVLGRSVVLFRPPFNADSEPRSYGEIMPVAVASEEGYVVAGETIDPNDWDIWRRNADGSRHRLTGAEITQTILQRSEFGQAILLHDGGGDRSATLASLDATITELQARGYRFTTIGELEGRTRDQTMPLTPAADRPIASLDAFVFAVTRIFNAIIFWGFTFAIALGLARIALMIGLAARAPRERPALSGRPRVDALVAAYNEAPVIVRTVSSLLASEGVDVHVIVVDDGSSDGTGDIVAREFAGDPRVRLERKTNGGKASALNRALALSDSPIVVGVDADTQLAADSLALLARWFVDPSVGAVAGNVKVGNRGRLVTRWQSLEYITSQNVDRRAMSRLNAITVVPGAIGAYRAEALRSVGGYRSDTLAEDMDLTWRLRRAGWEAVNERHAVAWTEAPETLGALMRQRFRWTFGTLQCLWKHRAALFRYGWFGGLALPTLWLFQFVAQLLAPFVDLQILVALIARAAAWISAMQHADVQTPDDPMLWVVLLIYVAFLALEIAAGAIAYEFDNEDKRELWLLPTQRFVYRQIMYLVVWRSLLRAFGGVGQGWGKLKRTGAVRAGG